MYSTAAPRVCGLECLVLPALHGTVHTRCTQAHHTELPLCDCDAESQGHAHLGQHNTTAYTSRRSHSTLNGISGFLDLRITRSALQTLDSRAQGDTECTPTTGQAHCLPTASGVGSQDVAHERTAIPTLHGGALKDWHEYDKEIESKVIRCECPQDTGSTNADSRAELSEPGRPSRRQRCHNLVLEGDGRGLFDNDIGRVCLSEQYTAVRQ